MGNSNNKYSDNDLFIDELQKNKITHEQQIKCEAIKEIVFSPTNSVEKVNEQNKGYKNFNTYIINLKGDKIIENIKILDNGYRSVTLFVDTIAVHSKLKESYWEFVGLDQLPLFLLNENTDCHINIVLGSKKTKDLKRNKRRMSDELNSSLKSKFKSPSMHSRNLNDIVNIKYDYINIKKHNIKPISPHGWKTGSFLITKEGEVY